MIHKAMKEGQREKNSPKITILILKVLKTALRQKYTFITFSPVKGNIKVKITGINKTQYQWLRLGITRELLGQNKSKTAH